MNDKTKELLRQACKSQGLGKEMTHSILLIIDTNKGLTGEVDTIEEAHVLVDRALNYFWKKS